MLKEGVILQAFAPKSPQQIFETVSPAIVSIISKTSNGEQYVGSGFIIDSQGIIVTNAHVVLPSRENILVKLKDGRVYSPSSNIVTIISMEKDIYIFGIKARNLPTVTLGSLKTMKIGESVYCVGSPAGLEYSFSNGILSGIRNVKGTLYPNTRFLQFTAPISAGNSGSPLLNSQGQVIGVVSSSYTNDLAQNLNFALAIDEVYGEIGVICQSLQQYQQAISNYQKASQSDPTNPIFYDSLASVYSELGKYSEAKTNYQKAKELFQKQGNSQGVQAGDEYLKKLP